MPPERLAAHAPVRGNADSRPHRARPVLFDGDGNRDPALVVHGVGMGHDDGREQPGARQVGLQRIHLLLLVGGALLPRNPLAHVLFVGSVETANGDGSIRGAGPGIHRYADAERVVPEIGDGLPVGLPGKRPRLVAKERKKPRAGGHDPARFRPLSQLQSKILQRRLGRRGILGERSDVPDVIGGEQERRAGLDGEFHADGVCFGVDPVADAALVESLRAKHFAETIHVLVDAPRQSRHGRRRPVLEGDQLRTLLHEGLEPVVLDAGERDLVWDSSRLVPGRGPGGSACRRLVLVGEHGRRRRHRKKQAPKGQARRARQAPEAGLSSFGEYNPAGSGHDFR